MKLTSHEQDLIEAIRKGTSRDPADPLTITISLGGGASVRWENQGFQGNGDGLSFDEAYGRAWEDYSAKFVRVALSLPPSTDESSNPH